MKSRTVVASFFVLFLGLGLAACSSDPAQPVSPTAPSSPAAVSGATISGSVAVSAGAAGAVGFGSLTSRTTASTSYTVVVTVAGTSLSTTTDGVGRFKLTGVPSGTVELKFNGGGMQGSVVLTGVKDADAIEVTVTLSESGASLGQASDPAGQVQLEGRVSALNPGGAANTLLVESTTVSVPGTAAIRHGDTSMAFSAIKVGDRLHVKGTKTGETLVASEVIVQNTNPTVPVNVSGAVSLLQTAFACPATRFTVAGWVVETSTATTFQKGDCAAIANGTTLHLKGEVQDSGRVLATWIQIGK